MKAPRSRRVHGLLLLAIPAAMLVCETPCPAQPFTVQGPGVNAADFRVTTFASGLSFPMGMAQLSDGSLLVTLVQNSNFTGGTSPGRLVRFTDTDGNGIADGAGTILYSNLPPGLTSLRLIDNLVFVEAVGNSITVLRTGATPDAPLTFAGKLIFTYPSGWFQHQNSELGLRRTPGLTNRYDLLFQVGAENNFAVTTRTATLTNDAIPGAAAELAGDSIHLITIIDGGTTLSATNLTHVASGLRNPAGYAFHPATGDFYFEDNGIDGLVDPNEPLSADELNFIARTNLGIVTPFFGFPSNYIAYRTGVVVGGDGIQPLIAFQPVPDPFTGAESEGASQITFAPPGFPDGLNTGLFIGFHGRFSLAGTNNEENPVVYANPANGSYFHFILGQQPGIGHLDGLLATRDSLFVADLVTTGNIGLGANAGAIYQIKSLVTPTPPLLTLQRVDAQLEIAWELGTLQEAAQAEGPWTDVQEAFSPMLLQDLADRKFYRVRY